MKTEPTIAKSPVDAQPIYAGSAEPLTVAEQLDAAIRHKVRYAMARNWGRLTPDEVFRAVSLAIRDRLIDGMLATEDRYVAANAKRLYYLSMEFLMGRSLGNNLVNLGLFEPCREALATEGIDIADALEAESDAALGNGGLGRLAACFLDSLATLDMPGFGYGINYEYGLFRQEIDNGYQRERPDAWRADGTPWTIERHSEAVVIPYFGRLEHGRDRQGNYNPMWLDWRVIIGVPHDMPVVGYGGKTINYLRLYSARSSHEFDMSIFNEGDYVKAVDQKIGSETISKVLYPSDTVVQGRELRLIQEYFLVACAVRDILRRYNLQHGDDLSKFAESVAIQLNDTHPALTVAELMRILIDENDLGWDQAWDITQATLGYTNHTLMPEALERWPVEMFERVLPRHLQIIYEINWKFLDEAAAHRPGDGAYLSRVSAIEDGAEKQVRMAHLAIIGSHSVNGVSQLHSDLVKSHLVPDFAELWPDKFNNKTNGVTQRRWVLSANPPLSSLITETIGAEWLTNLDELRGIEPKATDPEWAQRFLDVKRENKVRLTKLIADLTYIKVNPDTMFDVQVKRFHEYKRQLLNVLHIMKQYLALIEDGEMPATPKTYVFAGKAAPGYWAAKQIIKLINNVAQVVNNDRRVQDMIKVVFLPDYRVSLAERIIPAADLSEQISKAGTEASGTGNMKFTMNGALTIGTFDGANIEISEEVGMENIFIFGLKTHEIEQMDRDHSYHPASYLADREIGRLMEALRTGRFSPRDPDMFTWIYEAIVNKGDFYYHLADMGSYSEAQKQAQAEYADRLGWARKAILNVARSGKFSSDRTIREYAKDIWNIKSH